MAVEGCGSIPQQYRRVFGIGIEVTVSSFLLGRGTPQCRNGNRSCASVRPQAPVTAPQQAGLVRPGDQRGDARRGTQYHVIRDAV
jgi:hypothetical protein